MHTAAIVRSLLVLSLVGCSGQSEGVGAGLSPVLPPVASAPFTPGPTGGAYYRTVSPFEHYDSARTQVFPETSSLSDLGSANIRARVAALDFATPYIAFTRNRDELYVYGYGANANTEGAFVACVDPATLTQRWRTHILATEIPNQWSYPGVGLSHGNGFVYAIYANVLVKLDPATGAIVAQRFLPQDPTQTGAAYNGMVVMPDGVIVVKGMERGPYRPIPGASAQEEAFQGLLAGNRNRLPSTIVTVDPNNLNVLQRLTPPQPSTGRITAGRSGGQDYVYVAGDDSLFRYTYAAGQLTLDNGWGPVTYRTGNQKPGTAPGIMGDFVVVQTNFLPSDDPLSLTAVNVRDSGQKFTFTPFPESKASWNVSKMALDPETGMIITNDTTAGRMAGVRLTASGMQLVWSRPETTSCFSALVGDAQSRNVVVPDFDSSTGDRTLWLDETTGQTLASSQVLAPQPAPGNIVTPGFDGRFYYLSAEGRLWELTPGGSP